MEKFSKRVQEPLKFYSNSYLKRHDVKQLVRGAIGSGQRNDSSISPITAKNEVEECKTDDRYGLLHAISAVKACNHQFQDDHQALKPGKVFLIRGHLPQLASILKDRGWIQKFEEAEACDDLKFTARPNFIWDCHNDFVEWDLHNMDANVLLNRLKNPALYTSKLGMAQILHEEAHWLYEENVADVMFPRSYNPSRELAYFIRDFKRCAALALLKRFVNSTQQQYDHLLHQRDTEYQLVSVDQVSFALRHCEKYIDEMEHKDIDNDEDVLDQEWLSFLQILTRKTNKIKISTNDLDELQDYCATAQLVIEKLKDLDPQFELNGEQNLWIVKPSDLCCGSGIFITHQLQVILNRVKSKPKDYYVIQKYIERPLLVNGTKFDIRQWFLVTSTFPLTIWSFREALLRFSSKPYTTATYHEAIHLCNTAVQEKYHNLKSIRDQEWDCEQLNDYLKSVYNYGSAVEPYWDRIYPKMSQAIVLTMLAAQDFLDRRPCSFELYGADFMVMEDLSVWLIEINTNPRMHPPSSKISQRLYRSVLEDLIKNRPPPTQLDAVGPSEAGQASSTNVGNFQLIYKQIIPESYSNSPQHRSFFAYGKSIYGS